ncbi:MAG TPA: hypothetical protein VGF58_08045 [Burkholderiales bacterium]|jgi:hypothetical protein
MQSGFDFATGSGAAAAGDDSSRALSAVRMNPNPSAIAAQMPNATTQKDVRVLRAIISSPGNGYEVVKGSDEALQANFFLASFVSDRKIGVRK